MLDISTADREDIIDAIKSCGCLCVSGGNTFYLLQELKRENLLEIISDEISQGMIYIGESAGAMIVSKSIEYSKLMDDEGAAPDLNDYSGINVFDKYIVPHYGEEPFEECAEKMLASYSDSLKLIPINNNQAVVVEDNKCSIVENN